MNLPKRSSFKSLLKVYTMSKILLWIKLSYFSLENACDSWCLHQTRLFSSASVVSQSQPTELCSLAAVVPQSKSTKLCSSAAVGPQSKSTEMWSSAAPFHHDLSYFRHRTNEHSSSMLFIRKNVASKQQCHSSHWNQHTRPNDWRSYWREPYTHSTDIPLKVLMIPLKRVKLRGSVSEPVFKHNHCAPAFTAKNVVRLGSIFNIINK